MDDFDKRFKTDSTAASIMKGYRPERRSSELQAGARAELLPTPITRALMSMKGRLMARMLFGLRPPQSLKNYIALRIPAISHVLKQALPADVKHPLIIEVHAAFSPMGFLLTKELAHIDYWEIDLPEVIKEKKQRLQNAEDVVIPPNLVFKELDVSVTHLAYILKERKADIITISGAYIPPDQFKDFLTYLRRYLNKNGALVVALPWQAGIDEVASLKKFYMSEVGSSYNNMTSDSAVKDLFTGAGYSHVQISYLSEVAKQIGHPQPVEIEVIVTARP